MAMAQRHRQVCLADATASSSALQCLKRALTVPAAVAARALCVCVCVCVCVHAPSPLPLVSVLALTSRPRAHCSTRDRCRHAADCC